MIRRLLPLLLLAVGGAAQAAPSAREFAEQMLARFEAAGSDRAYRIKPGDDLVLQIRGDKGWGDGSVYLFRIFNYCQQASPKDCDTVAADFVRKMSQPGPAQELAAMRVIVRDKEYFDSASELLAKAGESPVSREIGDGLYAILAFDSPEAIAIADRGIIDALGVGDEAAWRIATEQTKAKLPKLAETGIPTGKATVFDGMEYLPSLLALIDEWRPIADKFGRDLAVTAVADNFVFVGFIPDGPDLDEFKQAARDDCNVQERCISPFVYRFRNGRWVVAN